MVLNEEVPPATRNTWQPNQQPLTSAYVSIVSCDNEDGNHEDNDDNNDNEDDDNDNDDYDKTIAH